MYFINIINFKLAAFHPGFLASQLDSYDIRHELDADMLVLLPCLQLHMSCASVAPRGQRCFRRKPEGSPVRWFPSPIAQALRRFSEIRISIQRPQFVLVIPLKLLPAIVIDVLHHELKSNLLQLLLILRLALFQLWEKERYIIYSTKFF